MPVRYQPEVSMCARLSVTLLLSLLLAGWTTAQDQKEPEKPVSQWIAELGDCDVSKSLPARAALKRVGPGAVTPLLKAFQESKVPSIRAEAAELLAEVAPKDPAVIRALIRAVENSDPVSGSVIFALRVMHPKPKAAVPALLKVLKEEKSGAVRLQAVHAVAEIADAKTATPALLAAFKGSDKVEVPIGMSLPADFHTSLADALGDVGPAAIPILRKALADNDRLVRGGAALALGYVLRDERVGASTVRAVVLELAELLKDKEPFVRAHAARALGFLRRDAAVAVPAFIQALSDVDLTVSVDAASTLGSIGPQAALAVPALIATLHQTDWVLRREVACALDQIGPGAKEAVPALVALLKDKNTSLRWAVADGLGGIGPAAKEAVPALITALKEGDKEMKRRAASALRGIGPAAKTAAPALREALKAADPILRKAAALALAAIDPAGVKSDMH
jgi:HEAT repeat protein